MIDLENYEKQLLKIDLVKANLFALFAMIPIVVLYAAPFYLIWKTKFTLVNFKAYFDQHLITNLSLFLFLNVVVLILGITLHEFIHGFTWSRFTKKGFKSIKFGVLWKMITPYCHCKEPLKVKEYIMGAIMPFIILGFIPFIIALFLGNIFVLLFAIVFTTSALGDFMIINLLRKEDKNALVLDHPTEAGCYIYKKA